MADDEPIPGQMTVDECIEIATGGLDGKPPTGESTGGLHPFMVIEAVHSTALSCGCGKCLSCRASGGDADAWRAIFTKLREWQEDR